MGFGKDGKGAIIREILSGGALGALASKDAVKFTTPTVLQEDFRILKCEIQAVLSGLTAGEGTGLIFGMSNGELTAAEIEECIEVAGPQDRNDRVAVEQAERNVHTLGVFQPNDPAETEAVLRGDNNSPLIVSKFRWTYSDPEGWGYWIYNLATGLTTGATLELKNTIYGVWVT